MKKFIFPILFLGVSLFYSCKKESVNGVLEMKVNRAEIKAKILSHSKGLDYYFSKVSNVVKKASGTPMPWEPEPPITGGGDPGEIPQVISDFLIEQGIPYTNEIRLVPQLHSSDLQYHGLSENGNKFSREFYEICISVTNISPEDVNDAQSLVDNILSSQKFLSLTQLEQTIIVAGAETYLDSFNYWSNRLLNQLPLASSTQLKGSSLDSYKKRKAWSWSDIKKRVSQYAAADAKGGIAGGIGGAAAGAIAGSFVGGIGAGPGALGGAIGGAVGTGITNSVLVFLDDSQTTGPIPTPILEVDREVYPGLFVPAFWDTFIQPQSYPNAPLPNIF